jgi:hypothetical protein
MVSIVLEGDAEAIATLFRSVSSGDALTATSLVPVARERGLPTRKFDAPGVERDPLTKIHHAGVEVPLVFGRSACHDRD